MTHLYRNEAPLAVQDNAQCRQCGTSEVCRILVYIGSQRQWVLAERVPEGYRVHHCQPELPKAA